MKTAKLVITAIVAAAVGAAAAIAVMKYGPTVKALVKSKFKKGTDGLDVEDVDAPVDFEIEEQE